MFIDRVSDPRDETISLTKQISGTFDYLILYIQTINAHNISVKINEYHMLRGACNQKYMR